MLLAVVIGVAVLSHGHGGGSPAPALTVGGQNPPDALGPGPEPGTPKVTPHSIGGQQVEFSWKYTNSASSDSFRVQVDGGNWKPVVPRKPDLVLSFAQGRVCIQVEVISASDMESSPSSVSCWPNS